MDIYWLGHASFRLRSTTTGLSIINDPYAANSGLGMQIDPRQIVDVVAVTVSHDNAMHNNAADLNDDARVFNTPGEYEFQGITVRAVMTGLPDDAPRSHRNVAYTIAIEGISICHLGNITKPLTAQQIDLIGPAEVVLAPAGGEDGNLLSHRAINQTAQQLDARWLIPMHYRAPGESSEVQPADPSAFLRELGVADGSLQPQGRMQVTRNNLPPSLQIGLLTPQIRSR
jgi:L-ascorbate metabolism protein UlaG (beta-lactamase superfamily)